MGAIPASVSSAFRAGASTWELRNLLLAAILSSDEEMLSITDASLKLAPNYKLVTTVSDDGQSITLIAEPK